MGEPGNKLARLARCSVDLGRERRGRAVVCRGKPLRLVLYEPDSAYHSGKYFLGSSEPDWDAAGRPQLDVLWGDP